MVKKAIFLAIFLILIINFVSATQINIISPQGGDVDEDDVYPQAKQFCDVDWDCTSWGKCVQGERTRACYDTNDCQFKYNFPVTKMDCVEETRLKPAATPEIQWLSFGIFTGIFLLILLIILLGLLI